MTMPIPARTAFLTFYSFAGAPTLRLVTWLHQLFGTLVVAAATLFSVRLLRTFQAFAEGILACNIVRHWEWADVYPSWDVREAFLTDTIRTRQSQSSVVSMIDGYSTRSASRWWMGSSRARRCETRSLAVPFGHHTGGPWHYHGRAHGRSARRPRG